MANSDRDASAAEEAAAEFGFDPAKLREKYREERDRLSVLKTGPHWNH